MLEKIRNSAKKWRKKAVNRAKEIKKLKKRLKEIIDSRNNWKNKADKFKAITEKEQKKTKNKKPKRYWYEIKIIKMTLSGKLSTSVSFQALSKLFAIINFYFQISIRTPTHTTEINWVHKIGYYLITMEKEKANDWIILLDHSIQIGNEKIFLVYGIRENQIDFSRPLTLQDLTPLVIKVQSKWNGKEVEKILSELKKELGIIIYAVGDYGSDIKKGLELSKITHIHDITHRIALIIEKMYKENDEYLRFTKNMSQMRMELSQSKFALIIPPKQKIKSRYQNIGLISDWGKKVLNIIKNGLKKDQEIYKKLSWVKKYKKFILELNEINKNIKKIEKITKHNGLSKNTIAKCLKELEKLTTEKGCLLKEKLNNYFNEIKEYLPKLNKLLCTSDIIESAFGKYKNFVSNNPMAGVTNLVLSLAAFTSDLSGEVIIKAFESSPIRKIIEWTENEIGDSVLKRRRLVFKAN